MTIRFFPGEQWKEISIGCQLKFHYAISNFGRFMSFSDSFENGKLLNGGDINGYRIFRYKAYVNDKMFNKHMFFHKLVAEYFLKPESPEHTHILHLNFVKTNNHVDNLRWATKEALLIHHNSNPLVIASREKFSKVNRTSRVYKLNEGRVKIIKKRLLDPNNKTRMKMMAKQFNVSEMQLYRIKSGENWGHVKID